MDGMITRASKDLKDAQAVAFKNYDFIIALDDVVGSAKAVRGRSESDMAELYDKVRKTKDKVIYVAWSFELHQRFAFPAACLILGLLGPPLGSIFRQKGRMTGITAGVMIFLVYYVLLSLTRTLAENYLLSPLIAVWVPNLIFLALGIYLWTKMHRESSFFLALLGRPLARLRRQGAKAPEQQRAIAH